MPQYGKIISRLRKEHNMTQAELGAKLNVSFQAVSKWENDLAQPDFATMNEIAKIFQVPLTVFAEENAAESRAAAVAESTEDDPLLGYCSVCGNIVHQSNVAQQRPKLVCRACAEEQAEKERAEAEAARKKRRDEELHRRARIRHMRNLGLGWGAVGGVILAVLAVIGVVAAKQNAGIAVLGGVFGALFGFTFIAQLFWDGFVADTALAGGKIIGTPGIIFSFDLDGFIFLIAMKILFAVLKFLVFLITSLACVLFAVVCSPFTFFPCLLRVNRGEEAD